MTPTLRAACAAIALSLAAQAGATDLWINSDSTSRENKLGSVVLLELGTTASCIICRTAAVPMVAQAGVTERERELDFYASVKRMRDAKASVVPDPPPPRFAKTGSNRYQGQPVAVPVPGSVDDFRNIGD